MFLPGLLPARLLRAMFAFVVLALSQPSLAVDEVLATGEGAIRGYDPVAYHLASRPVPGSPTITHDWNGATWRFASEANRTRFIAEPERYAPRYGGYCAYGTSRGYKVSSDPEAFAIVDGRLYLNYSQSVQRTWNLDRPGHIAKADREWRTLAATAYRPEK